MQNKSIISPIIMFIMIFMFSSAVMAADWNCVNCSDCNSKINSASAGDTIYLDTSISGQNVDCILINKSYITFDCQNNVIGGDSDLYGYGIYVKDPQSPYEDLTNITIKNCVVNNFRSGIYLEALSSTTINHSLIENVTVSDNYYQGIYLKGVDYTHLENITASHNSNGIYLEQSHSNEVHNLNASENSAGIRLYYSHSNNVQDITVFNNMYGVEISSEGSYDNTFNNIAAKENTWKDIYFDDVYTCSNTFNNITGSGDREIMIVNESVNLENKILSQLILCNADNSNITNVTIQGSSVYNNNGLFAYYVDNSNFTDITSSNNYHGIKLEGGADYAEHNTFNNLILNNNIGGNSGFEMKGRARYNNLTNITAANSTYGIRLLGYGFNNLQDIYFYDASLGIYSDNNSIKNVNVSGCSGSGITLFSGADSNSFQNITSNNNGEGIRLWSSMSDNNFINITTKENWANDIFYEPYSIAYCTNSFENVIGSGDREIILANNGINIENQILSHLILCNADNSNITNVTIQGSSVHDNNALYMYFTDNANLTGITSNDNRYGIYSVNWGDVSKNNIFEDITVNNNDQYGLFLRYVNNSDIINVDAANNSMYIRDSEYNLFENIVSPGSIIYLTSSDFNEIRNVISINGRVSLSSANNNNLDNITTNSGSHGIQLSSSHYNNIQNIYASNFGVAGGVNLMSSDNNNITNITCSHSRYKGVYIYNSDYNIFENVIVSNISQTFGNPPAMEIYSSHNNSFNDLISKNNKGYGMVFKWDSKDNSIMNSFILNNSLGGVYLDFTSPPQYNVFYNNLFNNTLNFNTSMDINYWNTTNQAGINILGGTMIGGNAWATPDRRGYSEKCIDQDNDSICDEQYNITADGLNIDYFPLFISEGEIPWAANFTGEETTNFSGEENLSNVTNMTLATEDATIQFPEDYSVDALGEDYDINIILGDCFVSVNASSLDYTFNATAYLIFNNSDGHCGNNIIYEDDTFSLSAEEIREGDQECEICSEIQKTNEFVTSFKVDHFSAYAIGSNTRLDIYDEYEGDTAPLDINITFYANYTNYTSGDHVGGANCQIEFDDNPGTTFAMTDNGANYNFTKSGGFSSGGAHSWNVTCSNAAEGWNTLNATDDIQVSAGAVIPEFSIMTLGLGLIAVLAGLIVMRKKR